MFVYCCYYVEVHLLLLCLGTYVVCCYCVEVLWSLLLCLGAFVIIVSSTFVVIVFRCLCCLSYCVEGQLLLLCLVIFVVCCYSVVLFIIRYYYCMFCFNS